eukprot:SAG11_NODE_30259_length_302_cov_1.487685_1_plen_34_part_01
MWTLRASLDGDVGVGVGGPRSVWVASRDRVGLVL